MSDPVGIMVLGVVLVVLGMAAVWTARAIFGLFRLSRFYDKEAGSLDTAHDIFAGLSSGELRRLVGELSLTRDAWNLGDRTLDLANKQREGRESADEMRELNAEYQSVMTTTLDDLISELRDSTARRDREFYEKLLAVRGRVRGVLARQAALESRTITTRE